MKHQMKVCTEGRLLTYQQVCSRVEMSPSTLRRHIQQGTFPSPIKPLPGGRMVRFGFEDVQTWLDSL